MKTLHIIRAPESQGRPEKYIADAVVTQLGNIIEKEDVSDVIRLNQIGPQVGPDPEQGLQFYDTLHTVNTFDQQLRQLLTEVNSGDFLFYVEGMSPLPQTVDYFLALKGIDVRRGAIFHSSVNTDGDLFNHVPTMFGLEHYVLGTYDMVAVGSAYLQQALRLSQRGSRKRNTIQVTGLPMPEKWAKPKRMVPGGGKPIVVWSHRWAEDKRHWVFKALAKNHRDSFHFLILTPKPLPPEEFNEVAALGINVQVCPDRTAYFRALNKGHILFSSARLETFGYSVLEGIAAGLIPIVPDEASYVELVAEEYRYTLSKTWEALDGDAIAKELALFMHQTLAYWNMEIKEGRTPTNPLTSTAQKYTAGGAEQAIAENILRAWLEN